MKQSYLLIYFSEIIIRKIGLMVKIGLTISSHLLLIENLDYDLMTFESAFIIWVFKNMFSKAVYSSAGN